MSREIVKRRARDLKPNPDQLRHGRDPAKLRELGLSVIKKQWHPLLIHADGTIRDGDGRREGVMLIDPDFELDCIIIDDLTEDQVQVVQLATAMHRTDLTAAEKAIGMGLYRDKHPGCTAKGMAAELGCSESLVSMHMAYFRLIPTAQQAVMNDNYTSRPATTKIPDPLRRFVLSSDN